jgi:hypothetical protein
VGEIGVSGRGTGGVGVRGRGERNEAKDQGASASRRVSKTALRKEYSQYSVTRLRTGGL